MGQFKYGCNTSHSGFMQLTMYQSDPTSRLFIQFIQMQYAVLYTTNTHAKHSIST